MVTFGSEELKPGNVSPRTPDIIAARRKACTSLIHICHDMPKELLVSKSERKKKGKEKKAKAKEGEVKKEYLYIFAFIYTHVSFFWYFFFSEVFFGLFIASSSFACPIDCAAFRFAERFRTKHAHGSNGRCQVCQSNNSALS